MLVLRVWGVLMVFTTKVLMLVDNSIQQKTQVSRTNTISKAIGPQEGCIFIRKAQELDIGTTLAYKLTVNLVSGIIHAKPTFQGDACPYYNCICNCWIIRLLLLFVVVPARISSRFVVAYVAVWIQVEYPLPLPEYAVLTYLESIIHDQRRRRYYACSLVFSQSDASWVAACFGLPVTLKHAWHRFLEEWLHIQKHLKVLVATWKRCKACSLTRVQVAWRNCK